MIEFSHKTSSSCSLSSCRPSITIDRYFCCFCSQGLSSLNQILAVPGRPTSGTLHMHPFAFSTKRLFGRSFVRSQYFQIIEPAAHRCFSLLSNLYSFLSLASTDLKSKLYQPPRCVSIWALRLRGVGCYLNFLFYCEV